MTLETNLQIRIFLEDNEEKLAQEFTQLKSSPGLHMQYLKTVYGECEHFVDFIVEDMNYELEENSYDEISEVLWRNYVESQYQKELKPKKFWDKDGF